MRRDLRPEEAPNYAARNNTKNLIQQLEAGKKVD
jgi:hypothetical protein